MAEAEPMTPKQAAYLKQLCEEAGEEFDSTLSKETAWARIHRLKLASLPSREEVRTVECPLCGAVAGKHCVGRDGAERKANHRLRVTHAQRVLAEQKKKAAA